MSHGSYDLNLGSIRLILARDIRSRSWPNIGDSYGMSKKSFLNQTIYVHTKIWLYGKSFLNQDSFLNWDFTVYCKDSIIEALFCRGTSKTVSRTRQKFYKLINSYLPREKANSNSWSCWRRPELLTLGFIFCYVCCNLRREYPA
jgi:hypothetical protein